MQNRRPLWRPRLASDGADTVARYASSIRESVIVGESDLPDNTLLFDYADANLVTETRRYVDNHRVWLDRRTAVHRYAPVVCEAFDADRGRLRAPLDAPVLHADHDMDQVMRELARAAIGLLDGRWSRTQSLDLCRERLDRRTARVTRSLPFRPLLTPVLRIGSVRAACIAAAAVAAAAAAERNDRVS